MEWLEPEASSEGARIEYFFALPSRTEVVRIERATRNGQAVPVNSYRMEPADWTRHDHAEHSIISRDLVSFVMTGLSGEGDVIQLQASLMPRVDAAGITSDLAGRYREAIAAGAKAELMLTPDTAFYMPDLAQAFRAEFDRAINAHCVDVFRGHTNQVPRANVKWC
jgi:hypothetical protein